MKKLIVRIVVVTLVLLVVALVAVFFSLNSIVKKGVETFGPEMTKVEVRLGGAKILPLSGSGELTGLFVGNPEGYKTPSAIKMGSIRVGVQPMSVLSGTIVVNEVNIQAPEITFEGGLSGNNLSKILDNLTASAASGTPSKTDPTSPKPEKKYCVKELVMKGGKIHLSVNSSLGNKEMTVPLPDVHMQNIGTPENGVTAAEMSKLIMKSLLASTTQAVGEALTGLSKGVLDIGTGSPEDVNKAAKGIKDLFKKK